MNPPWYQYTSRGIAVAILAGASFSLALWLARPKDREHLYAFLASLCSAGFAVISSLQVVAPASSLNFMLERLGFTFLLTLAPTSVAFALSINRRSVSNVLLTMLAISSGFIILVFGTNLVVSPHFIVRNFLGWRLIEPMPGPLAPLMFIYLLAASYVTLSQLFRFARRQIRTQTALVIGSSIFAAAALNDIFTEFGVVTYGYFFNFGAFGLALCFSAVALANHVELLKKAESASDHLKDAVAAKNSELVDVQARFLQEHQTASLGRLSAGIAHEINNPLAAIQANLTFISDTLPPDRDPNIEAALTESFEACQRASQIVKDLSLFARRKPTKATRIRLSPPVSTALRFLTRAYPSAQNVHCSFDSSVEIIGDESKIAQIATNLLENALHAIEELPSGRGKIQVSIQRQGDKAVFIVADNGPGVPPDRRQQIFVPFFTTKEIGRGTGLGLAICARLVEDHQGTIRVEDNPGGGSRFVVELPLP